MAIDQTRILELFSDAIRSLSTIINEVIDDQPKPPKPSQSAAGPVPHVESEEEPKLFTIQVAVPGYNVIDTTHRAGIAKIRLAKLKESE